MPGLGQALVKCESRNRHRRKGEPRPERQGRRQCPLNFDFTCNRDRPSTLTDAYEKLRRSGGLHRNDCGV
jgi:hypothetical protein